MDPKETYSSAAHFPFGCPNPNCSVQIFLPDPIRHHAEVTRHKIECPNDPKTMADHETHLKHRVQIKHQPQIHRKPVPPTQTASQIELSQEPLLDIVSYNPYAPGGNAWKTPTLSILVGEQKYPGQWIYERPITNAPSFDAMYPDSLDHISIHSKTMESSPLIPQLRCGPRVKSSRTPQYQAGTLLPEPVYAVVPGSEKRRRRLFSWEEMIG